jgi:hypothetical protein
MICRDEVYHFLPTCLYNLWSTTWAYNIDDFLRNKAQHVCRLKPPVLVSLCFFIKSRIKRKKIIIIIIINNNK